MSNTTGELVTADDLKSCIDPIVEILSQVAEGSKSTSSVLGNQQEHINALGSEVEVLRQKLRLVTGVLEVTLTQLAGVIPAEKLAVAQGTLEQMKAIDN